MLKDVTKLTKRIFDEVFDSFESSKGLYSAKHTYDVYRALEAVISDTSLVAEHYLVLTFEEEYLQNSSYGKPVDKWRYTLNDDFKTLNKSVCRYLHKLSCMAFEDAIEPLMAKHYKSKSFYAMVNEPNTYILGYIEPCSTIVESTTIKVKFNQRLEHFRRYSKIDLRYYEDRVDLQTKLLKRKKLLEVEYKRLKTYIEERYELNDLLED